jgi:hypothetical protein
MRLGLKKIELAQVINDYNSIIENTHFNVPDDKVIPEDLKKIESLDVGMLMALGTVGLHFVGTVIRSKLEGYELAAQQEWEIYCICDGFGKLPPEELKEINEGWDWSHIRDSSPEALLEAEHLVKNFLLEIYNNKL